MGVFSFFGKDSNYTAEYDRFKKAMRKNPADHGLKAQFIKLCLLNRFTKQENTEAHIAEALQLFETIQNVEPFDLQCHYLVGKYHQESQNFKKAYQIYLSAIKRFNKMAVQSPNLKGENAELAYSVALNLMTLQWNPVDPEVEICFKIIKKSFPLHLKRIEFENEMAKPAPDQKRVKQLAEDLRKLREEDEKEAQAFQVAKEAAAAKAQKTEEASPTGKTTEKAKTSSLPEIKAKEPKGIFSKLFDELSPDAMGLTPTADGSKGTGAKETGKKGEKAESLKFTPPEASAQNATFMAYHGDQWEGPFTLAQFKEKGFLKPVTWVCRAGTQQVMQAYEVPDLQTLLKN
jgi:hypothetical protein